MNIKGNWGVGKTYFWRCTVEEASKNGRIGHKSYSYVSLFGVDSLETLKNSITANQISALSIGRTVNMSASVLYSRIKNFLKYLERSPYIRNFSGGLASELAFQTVSNCLICVDDLERKSRNLEIKDILGLASFLKEQRNCKIVFILNDGTFLENDRESFELHNEKVVDTELSFAPSAEDVFGYIFDASHLYFDLVKSSCLTLEIKNVRILQRIKRAIEDILLHLENIEPIVVTSIIQSTILFVWSNYNKDGETISLDFLEDFSNIMLYIRKEIRKETVTEDEEKKYELLSKLEYGQTDELDKQIITYVKRGFLSEEFFTELKTKNQQAIAQKGQNSYSEAWKLYKTNFDLDENEFINSLVKGFRSNEEFLSIGDLYNVADTLRKFDRKELANELIDEYVPKKVNYESLVKMKQYPHFQEYKDEYFLKKLNETPRPDAHYDFATVVNTLASKDYFWGDEVSFLAGCDESIYYDFFKKEKSENIYYIAKFLLRNGRSDEQSPQNLLVLQKTKKALLKIAQENRINHVRISDWFEELRDELNQTAEEYIVNGSQNYFGIRCPMWHN